MIILSNSIQTLSRLYKDTPLASDEIVTGSVQTYMSNSVITDSTSAATAFATGKCTTI
ncbi:MAG: alkaline phosphatase [Desulfamplus sp.]|nr:alkaline phosphatase [Desulfamplus sp.]